MECDGASYHRAATARDRDRLREKVLRGLGWKIVRIWSTDWWHNAKDALNKLNNKLEDIRLNNKLENIRGELGDAGNAISIPAALEDSANASVMEPTSQIAYAAQTNIAQAVKQLPQTDGTTAELLSNGRKDCLATTQNERAIAATLDERWDKGKPARQKQQGKGGYSAASYQHTENSKHNINNGIVASAPETDGNCEKCGSPMQTKKGKFSLFLACTAYPKCSNTKPLESDGAGAGNDPKPAEPLEGKCPKCGSGLVIKNTRAGGRLIACTGYPKCRYSRGLPVGVACPDCGGAIVEKTSPKRSKLFFGCSNYPKCSFAIWDRPLNEACPKCGYPFLLEKTARQGITVRCSARNCDYQK
ncbi:hypothetical protein DFAR_340017 [Desulfarculales bacterium]